MLSKKKLFIALGLIYLFRLIATQFMGLMPQDAYYYYYSEELALSYFDHPPMVAYMLYFFTGIFEKSVAVIKLTDFIVTLGSFIGFYYLTNLFLDKKQTQKTTLVYGATIMISILSINTTPDVPLIFFWTLSLVVLYKAVFENKLIYWLTAGILIGLSFDSKYTALFILFGLFFFLVLSAKHRHFLFSKELFLLVFFFLLTISPVFIWNQENDWMSFRFQSSDRASSIMALQLSPKYFFGNLATQIFLLLPPLFGAVAYMFYKLAKKTINIRLLPDEKTLFLLAFSLPIIGFFFGVSLFYWVKLNWIMPGYITAIILVGRNISKRMMSYQLMTAVGIHILVFIQLIFYPFPLKTDDTWVGWGELSEEVKTLQTQYPDRFIFSNDIYKTSAQLSFYLEDTIYAGNIIGQKAFQFSVRQPDLKHLIGQNALYIDSDRRIKNPDKLNRIPNKLDEYFETIIELDPILIKNKKGKLLRKFWVFDCKKYKGPNRADNTAS